LGQKVHPIGFRLGIIRTWDSKWYAEGDYARLLHEDIKLRSYLKKRLYHAGISKIELERAASKAKINIFAARPGIIIGKKGSEVEALKKELAKLTDKEVFINIQEVQTGNRCPAGRGKRRAAARAPGRLSPRYEEECQSGPQVRCAGDQDQLQWLPWRCRDEPDRVVS
jgi:hypothetical protein